MAKLVLRVAPALILGAVLSTPAAYAGTVGATLTVDQIRIEVWALQPGATPSYDTHRFSSMQESSLHNVDDNSLINDYQEFLSPGTWTTSIGQGGSRASTSSNMPWETATASVQLDLHDAPWVDGNSHIYSFDLLKLSPRTGMTISGHMNVAFQNDYGPGAWADATLSTCVMAYQSWCDAGFGRIVTISANPEGLDQDFSFTFLNPANSTLPMEWDILLDVNAVSPVPEPASWGMLLAGLGMGGGMGRMRKMGAC